MNRSGYDRRVSGDDEARARASLLEMQLRLAQGPQAALGIEATTPEAVRAAFLELTKQFHPQKFGRMSPDVQKLSTEVFLGIKSAHDTLMGSAHPRRGGRSTGMPPIRAEASERTAKPAPSTLTRAPDTDRRPTPARVKVAEGSASFPAQRHTPPRGIPIVSAPIPATPVPPTRPTPPVRPRAAQPAGFDEAGALQAALDLLSAKQWGEARQALHALAARVPQSKQYRALLCYARGREAHAARRIDDAVTEYKKALELDPALGEAKQALVQLRRR